MSTLCFGGSFNPIHHGHLICAQAVAEACKFDRIRLIPSAQPPHKPRHIDMAPAEDRLRMCQLAIARSALLEVNDVEIRRGGASYTIDTVRAFRRGGEKAVHWLIGADMLAILPQWHEAEALLREVNFVVMGRPGWEFYFSRLPAAYGFLREKVVEAPLIDIAATNIRQRVREGRPITWLAPAEVEEYIRLKRLYIPESR